MAYGRFSNRPSLSSRTSRSAVGLCNLLTWISSAIVTGITAYFLNKYPHDQHLIFEIVISALVLAFWIPAVALPFLSSYKFFYALPNFIFSYLWLTSFIFAAQDYNEGSCRGNAPTGGSCNLKLTSEAFIFLAFFFSFAAALLDAAAWKSAAVAAAEPVHPEKPEPAPVAEPTTTV